jgi:hypothetical protein
MKLQRRKFRRHTSHPLLSFFQKLKALPNIVGSSDTPFTERTPGNRHASDKARMDLILVENTVRRFFRFALKIENLERFIGPPEPKRTAAEDQMIRRKNYLDAKAAIPSAKSLSLLEKITRI